MKFISYIVVAVLSFGAALYFSGVADSNADAYDFSQNSYVEEDKIETTAYSTYYDQLNSYQKSIYKALIGPISRAEDTITLKDVNINDFSNNCFQASIAVQYDHPEYFWFTGGYRLSGSHVRFEETGTVEFEPIYYEYVSPMFDSEKKLSMLESMVRSIAGYARSHSSDSYEQMIYVHDFLIENAIYDMDGLEEYYKTSHNPSCEYIFSAYGCLVEGKTVCSGYAKAYQLILNELGYDCTYVTGDAGEAHAWNCVYVDGEGYYVDVTWDDIDLENEVPMYDYAFIDNKSLNKSHQVDMEFAAPVCNSMDYNYFVKNNYYLEEYDFDSAADILSVQSLQDGAYIRFGSLKELGHAYDDLITRGKCKKIKGLDSFGSYNYNEDQCTLTFIR